MNSKIQEQSLSVFDRLLDFEPELNKDDVLSDRKKTQFKKILESVRRDLELLLNTQQPFIEPADSFYELQNSLVQYGTPGFQGLLLSTKQQQLGLAKSIEKLITIYEPRLKKTKVSLVEDKTKNIRMLHLKISAILQFDDTSEDIAFDTTLDPAIRHFKIGGKSSS